MKQVKNVIPKTPVKQAKAKEPYPYTHKIEFLGVGKSESGDRYLRRRVGNDVALISVAKLIADPTPEYVRLQRVGVILPELVDRKELMGRVRIEASKKATFDVATEPGLLGNEFFFPDGPASGKSNNGFYPDEGHLDTYRKFHCAGSRAGWNQLMELHKGNSRIILGDALACAGPICAAFGFEPPGVQFVGKGGVGKTPLARMISAIWGWDPTPTTRLGFGTSWKMKPGGLEVIAGAYNHTFIYLDEMSKATAEQVEFVMTIMQGQGTARMTELRRRIWCMPVLSTSNKSIVELMMKLGLEFDAAYVDRLLDIPSPSETCYVENLHGLKDIADYAAQGCQLAGRNHGWAGHELVRKFGQALRSDRAELERYVDEARADYVSAAEGITSTWRDLVRVHGRFATCYAAGRVANRFGVLPFKKEELLAAILTCERDHVAFIDQEVRRLGARELPAVNAQGANAAQTTILDVVTIAEQLFVRMKGFVNDNCKGGFLDLRKPNAGKPGLGGARKPLATGGPVLGYIGEKDGGLEYRIPNPIFEKVAGGAAEGQALKEDLFRRGLLVTDRRGDRVSYVVKRKLPDGTRRNFVVLRAKPRR